MVSYAGKLVLAPMVRAGELPTRLLALKHGADLVWGPEIVDKKLIQCRREINEALKTVDFIIGNKEEGKSPVVVFRTLPEAESGKLIFQLGTASPLLAVEAANIVIRDIDGIDVNAGCPKHFSIHSGMGAALLKTPDTLCSILEALVEKVGKPNNKPISVKIRLLEDERSTLELVSKLCNTGISNLTVHCRTTPMRNREMPIRDYLPGIHSICRERNVSLIMNGAIESRAQFMAVRKELQLPEDVGGMIAEAAEQNATVFSESPLPWYAAVKEYLAIARNVGHVMNVKFMLGRMIPGKSPFYNYFTRCKRIEEIEYVMKHMDEKGGCTEDLSAYLEQCRKEDKKSAEKLNAAKAKSGAKAKNGSKKRPIKEDTINGDEGKKMSRVNA
ncbi:HER177Wp [Eremothecium sinecaudum]|uniref:tRNA-dihydrouridine(20) synthase [NAD(P)+] n=1 Tax=Eremothecium sinecaudum TaxID=45286 RepID=A0A0X8HU27_9SACH|nr:HER177Wp [Eremothecium sinecaudum]AMD21456.1 HER177Wp [Eremothecium sinecaudum]